MTEVLERRFQAIGATHRQRANDAAAAGSVRAVGRLPNLILNRWRDCAGECGEKSFDENGIKNSDPRDSKRTGTETERHHRRNSEGSARGGRDEGNIDPRDGMNRIALRSHTTRRCGELIRYRKRLAHDGLEVVAVE